MRASCSGASIDSHNGPGHCGLLLPQRLERYCYHDIKGVSLHTSHSRDAQLLVGDCVIGKDTIVLTLRDTKIGVRTGIHQTVDIDDPWLVACFSAMVQDKQRGQRLVSCDPATFRKRWKQALKALRIPAVYNPYGLRRGGATSLFLHTGSFDRVMEKGRWRSLHAMRQYLNLSMGKLAADTEHSAFEHVCFQEARQLHSLAM